MAGRTDAPIIDLVTAGFAPSAPPDAPIYHRLRDHLRDLIRREHLHPGARLPSSRVLAQDLGVSRTTVELAYDELVDEGFVERRRGSGTYVVELIPARPRPLAEVSRSSGSAATGPPALSAAGQRLASVHRFRDDPAAPAGFAPCLPGEDAFPIAAWNQLVVDTLHERGRRLQRSTPLLGDYALRTALADHLARTRRVQCDAGRVLILSSTQQALGLLARLLLDAGDAMWLEEPGYLGARAVFEASGARVVPVPVDADGLAVEAGIEAAPEARLAYVTPSHQYPTGVTLSAARRVALLGWARTAGRWVIEDDYDSEFRHVGGPLAPLQSSDREGRVVYVGTFNKVLFPGLRLAYAVLPDALVGPAERAVETFGGQPSSIVQAAAATFVAQGHFAAHLRRTRDLYRTRRNALLDAAGEGLGEVLEMGPSDTGLHVCARLERGVSDLDISARAAAAGLHVPPLSPCYLGAAAEPGLILGYAGVDERTLRRGVTQLTDLLREA
ncbi:MAG: PLP-dependent aminotransferase family protein [Bacteroidota bacterium]